MSYARVLAHYPYVVVAVVLLCAATCLVVTVTVTKAPDFSKPKEGFESRGTDISQRWHAWHRLLDETESDWSMGGLPHYNRIRKQPEQEDISSNARRKANRTVGPPSDVRPKRDVQDFQTCGLPRKEYSRMVFESRDGGTLFSLSNILSMCQIEASQVRPLPAFTSACVPVNQYSHRCCPSWSLGNYVALLNNRSSCGELTQRDVDRAYRLLVSCLPFYRNMSLLPNCHLGDPTATTGGSTCHNLPAQCLEHHAAFSLLHYVLDINFADAGDGSTEPRVTYAVTFLPVARGLASLDLYKSVQARSLSDANVRVVAMDLGVKQAMFDHYLLLDCVWIGLALLLIFLCMWLYTGSAFITAMSLLAVVMTLIISYFVYTLVFDVAFFPFMNLLTVVILIGLGADDVFIYCRMWKLSKAERNTATLEKLIRDTLKHACLSMFVTSLTTAAAFYVAYISSVTSLKCFAIYAGTSVLVNFLLMVTWVPATVVIHEKWCSTCLACCYSDIYASHKDVSYYVCKAPRQLYYSLSEWARIFFEKFLPYAVVRLRILWFVIFSVLGVCGILATVYYPKLKLPSANAFKVFSPHHPFEVYDFVMKEQFWFEKAAGSGAATMPLVVVWGVVPVDNGNYLDPRQEGSLVLDQTFNMASPAAQKWLLGFCGRLRMTRFYQRTPGLQLTNCFIENFKRWMERPCGIPQEACCGYHDIPDQGGTSTFPFPEPVFRECLRQYVPQLQKSAFLYKSNKYAGPRYLKTSADMAALIVEFDSTQVYTYSYQEMRDFYTSMNQWVNQQLLTAPPGMRGGWFISDLDFYDIQASVAHSTLTSIGVSLAIAALVAFFTTLNILVTLYALVTIAFVVFVTVGCLVMLGWELNILESVTISVAVGLSIDFTLHYGVAYRLSPDLDKELRVVFSLTKMGSPLAMAAWTTFLAGVAMTPATVLAYRQLGLFLVILMTVSWSYSTFFFLTLLRLFGPQGTFGQFHWPGCDCCCYSEKEHVDKTIYTMSESTLSSSSNHGNNSETHELEPLADRDHHHHHHHHHHHSHRHKYRYAHRLTPTGSQDNVENANYLSTAKDKHQNQPANQHTAQPTSNGGHHIPSEDEHQEQMAPLRQGEGDGADYTTSTNIV